MSGWLVPIAIALFVLVLLAAALVPHNLRVHRARKAYRALPAEVREQCERTGRPAQPGRFPPASSWLERAVRMASISRSSSPARRRAAASKRRPFARAAPRG